MGYKENYYLGKTYAEHQIYGLTKQSVIDNRINLDSLAKIVQNKFDDGINRIIESQTSEVESAISEIRIIEQRISEGTEHLSSDLRQSAFEIVNSIDNASYQIVDSIKFLTDCMSSGFMDLKWEIEQNTIYTKKILEVLINSLDNESVQYYKQGVKCFSTGEYEMARERFNMALIKNKTNLFAYEYLGFICINEEKTDEAEKNFKLAYKFSETEYHKAIALSHLARHFYSLNNYPEANNFGSKALSIYRDSADLWYYNAIYYCLNSRFDECVKNLKEAIVRDWKYWAIALIEKELEPAKEDIGRLYKQLKIDKLLEARDILSKLKTYLDNADNLEFTGDTNKLKEFYNESIRKLNSKNIYNIIGVLKQSPEIISQCIENINRSNNSRENEIKHTVLSIERKRKEHEKTLKEIETEKITREPNEIIKIKNNRMIFTYIIWIGALFLTFFVLSAIAGSGEKLILSYSGKSKTPFFVLILGIPTITTILLLLLIKFKDIIKTKRFQKRNDDYSIELNKWYKNSVKGINNKYDTERMDFEYKVENLRSQIKESNKIIEYLNPNIIKNDKQDAIVDAYK